MSAKTHSQSLSNNCPDLSHTAKPDEMKILFLARGGDWHRPRQARLKRLGRNFKKSPQTGLNSPPYTRFPSPPT
jgi:hypothetical protein